MLVLLRRGRHTWFEMEKARCGRAGAVGVQEAGGNGTSWILCLGSRLIS